MGKRELLLVVGFIVAGALIYQVTAPPSRPGESGFSFAKMYDSFRRQMHGNPASATVTRTETIAVGDSMTDVRVSGVTGKLEIQGEARTDISYDLQIESNGPDEATARSLAGRVVVKRDDLGSSMTLRLIYPREARQRAIMVMRIPARLAVRIEGSNVTVSNVAAVRFEGVVGDVTVRGVAREVTGTHRNGDLQVADVGSTSLTLVSSNATLTGVRGAVTINARNGDCTIHAPRGAVEIDETSNDVKILAPAAPVRVTGTNGSVTIERPKAEIRIDGRRVEVEVTLDAAVPVTALTTDDTLRLLLDGPPSVVVDATATDGGSVQARDFELDVPAGDGDQHLTHAFGAAASVRVALRNQHGAIVIRKAK